jgi:diacylglycerol O-acyltransferase / wax synthase
MDGQVEMNTVLDLADQLIFLGERATGSTSLLQAVWTYDRAVDIDGLRRFHDHLLRGRLFRHVERSPLPFGRHRWVTPNDTPTIELAPARPREEFGAWLDEQANTPLDNEYGPTWQLAVLPFDDGGTGLSLVISHVLTDGVGFTTALADAASGRDDAVTWAPARSRRRWSALRRDARRAALDMPSVAQAIGAAARMVWRARRASAAAPESAPSSAPNEQLDLPAATVFVDTREWDACAQSLGGTSNSLLAGFAAKFAQRVGRVTADDGLAQLSMPINERTDGDTRANAVGNIDLTVDPTKVTADLKELRAAVKQGLIRANEVPDEKYALLPLVPFLSERLVKKMVDVAGGGATNTCSSNLGDIDIAVNRPDGTAAESFAIRSLYPRVTRATMHSAGGVLAMLSGRVNGRVFISVLAYDPARPGSNRQLQEAIFSTLADFGLAATMQWDSQPDGRRAQCAESSNRALRD